VLVLSRKLPAAPDSFFQDVPRGQSIRPGCFLGCVFADDFIMTNLFFSHPLRADEVHGVTRAVSVTSLAQVIRTIFFSLR